MGGDTFERCVADHDPASPHRQSSRHLEQLVIGYLQPFVIP
jgi:hypothetical protein